MARCAQHLRFGGWAALCLTLAACGPSSSTTDADAIAELEERWLGTYMLNTNGHTGRSVTFMTFLADGTAIRRLKRCDTTDSTTRFAWEVADPETIEVRSPETLESRRFIMRIFVDPTACGPHRYVTNEDEGPDTETGVFMILGDFDLVNPSGSFSEDHVAPSCEIEPVDQDAAACLANVFEQTTDG